ncbi:hypothetical protein MN116_005239 [Schistosoma mekongi]|uniref:Uncharacterized protein n=1 Tax=Schistosoma mekongi TaxID=38744 RepID=A0AAE2D5D4_SCHME|nr:hypothetical protein MN116_005239 [Schistosoma mekongi]
MIVIRKMRAEYSRRVYRSKVRRIEASRYHDTPPSSSNYGSKYCDSIVHAAPKPESLPLPPDEWVSFCCTSSDLSGITQHLRLLLRMQTA